MLNLFDQRLRAVHVWVLNGLAIAWFAGLSLASTRAMPEMVNHRCPIGLCLSGYPPEVARRFFAEIGPKGREFLAQTFTPFDYVLPVLLAVALAATLAYTTRPPSAGGRLSLGAGWRWTLLALPLLYCCADLAENAAVSRMLAEHAAISDQLAHRASLLTAAKSQLVAAAIGFAAALVALSWFLPAPDPAGGRGAERDKVH